MSVLRWLRIVGILAAVALGAALIAVNWIDPNDYKDAIAAQVERKTGLDLTLHGDIELSLLPRIALRIGRFELSHRADFAQRDGAPMLAAEDAAYQVQWSSLLRGGWQAGAVTLHRPHAHFIRRADGVANWEDWSARDSSGGAPFAVLALLDVNIDHGQLRWDDHAAGRAVRLSNLVFSGGRIASDEAAHWTLAVDVEHNAWPLRFNVAATGAARLNARRDAIRFDRAQITARSRYPMRGDRFAPIATEFNAAQIDYAIRTGALAARGDGAIQVAATAADFDFAFADDRITLDDLRVRGADGRSLLEAERLILPFRSLDRGYAFQPERFAALNAPTLRRAWPQIVTAFSELADALELD